MKISCSQEDLARGLAAVKPAVSSNSALPILTHLLLDARGNDRRLRLAATNLDMGIAGWIPAQVDEAGAVAIPARLICDFVNTLTAGPIEMALNAQTQVLHLNCGRMNANIKGIDATEFPEMAQKAEPKAQISLDAKPLREMLDRVTFAVATDGSRPVLAGVLAKFNANRLTLAAVDGFRLSMQHTGIGESVEPFSLIIPAQALEHVSRLCAGQEEPAKFLLASNQNQVRFVFTASEVISQLIEGAFPDVLNLIPQGHTSRAVVNASELLTATKMVSAFVDKSGRANGVHLEADPVNSRVIVMGAHAERGDGVGDVDAAIEGDAFQVSLQSPFLLSLLERVTAPQVAIEYQNNAGQPGPVVVRVVGDDDFVHVMMPLVGAAPAA